MSLFADYVKEFRGFQTIEVEGGFITYDLKPPECSIEEFYVVPSLRNGRLAKKLADRVFYEAKLAGAVRMWASVTPGRTGADHAMRTNLHYGFRLVGTRGNEVILMKEII